MWKLSLVFLPILCVLNVLFVFQKIERIMSVSLSRQGLSVIPPKWSAEAWQRFISRTGLLGNQTPATIEINVLSVKCHTSARIHRTNLAQIVPGPEEMRNVTTRKSTTGEKKEKQGDAVYFGNGTFKASWVNNTFTCLHRSLSPW